MVHGQFGEDMHNPKKPLSFSHLLDYMKVFLKLLSKSGTKNVDGQKWVKVERARQQIR